jgi:hypothetical protein
VKDFTLKHREEQHKIDGRVYTVREIGGRAREEFDTFLESKTKRDPVTRRALSRDLAGVNAFLLARSLVDPDGKTIDAKVIESWPTSTVDGLAEIAERLSGLFQPVNAEGNAQGASGPGGSASPAS